MNRAQSAPRREADRAQLLARFSAAARRLRDASDARAVHDVRVAARRLEAALNLWQDRLNRRPVREARRALRNLRHSLGPAGEIHSSLDLLAERWPHLGPEARAVALRVISRGRRRARRPDPRGARLRSPKKLARLQRRIEKAWPELPDDTGSSSWIEWAGRRLEVRRARAREALRQALSTMTDDSLHSARVAVKRWRYSVERFEAVVPGGADPGPPWFKSVQGALGRVQDLRVLREKTLQITAGLDLADRRAALNGQLRLLEDLEAERFVRVAEFRHLVETASPVPPPA